MIGEMPEINFNELIGKKCTFLMQPNLLRDWCVIRETKKCLVIAKTFPKRYGTKNVYSGEYHIQKKLFSKVIKSEEIKQAEKRE
jgi:hypothetical protein